MKKLLLVVPLVALLLMGGAALAHRHGHRLQSPRALTTSVSLPGIDLTFDPPSPGTVPTLSSAQALATLPPQGGWDSVRKMGVISITPILGVLTSGEADHALAWDFHETGCFLRVGGPVPLPGEAFQPPPCVPTRDIYINATTGAFIEATT